jgi:GT2 family glycosyltransferase
MNDVQHPATEAETRPFVSVVIPHYNDVVALARCHDHLRQQTWPSDRFEIVVADNMSACGLDAVRMAAPSATIVLAPVQGAGPARNTGVETSHGEILAFLDSDCVPQPDWLAEGFAALGTYDFVGGQVKVFSRDPEKPNPVESFEMVFNFNFRRYIEKVGFTGTGNMFVPRRIFKEVGGFRNGVSEDMDWSFRARALGYRLGYAERAIVGHPARSDWPELKRRWQRLIAETYELRREQTLGSLAFTVRAFMMPLSIPPHAARIIASNRLPSRTAKLGALSILIRLRLWRMREMLAVVFRSRTPRGSGLST